jgi:hypothetical protein
MKEHPTNPPQIGKLEKLSRYTTLPVLLDLLKRRRLVLLDPKSWEDKNDSGVMLEYRRRKDVPRLFAIGSVPATSGRDNEVKPLLRSYWPEGGGDFQAKRIEFDPTAMRWEAGRTGLRFLVSEDFGEWLNEEAAAVNTFTRASLCSAYYPPVRGNFSARSTGKYKNKKVGFRLCYLHGEPTAENHG